MVLREGEGLEGVCVVCGSRGRGWSVCVCVEVGEGLECVCVEGGAGECVEVGGGAGEYVKTNTANNHICIPFSLLPSFSPLLPSPLFLSSPSFSPPSLSSPLFHSVVGCFFPQYNSWSSPWPCLHFSLFSSPIFFPSYYYNSG